MANEFDPVVGQWYLHHDKGEMFQVAAFDRDEGLIEIQYFDGDLEELTAEQWLALDVEACEQPEDWTGPYDDVERDDLGYTETEMAGRDWRAPLEGVPPVAEAWEETASEDEQDQWGEGRPREPYAEEEDTTNPR